MAAPPEGMFLSLELENDSFGSNDDCFYTHGTQISLSIIDGTPTLLKKIADILPFYRSGEIGLFDLAVGQKIFTPANTKERSLIRGDRPYAGWAYVQTGTAQLFEDRGESDWLNGYSLAVGMVGPSSLAKETQKEFHRLIGVAVPQGWGNQLHDEPGFIFSYLRKYRRIFSLHEIRQTEFSCHGGLTLGNVYTYMSSGLMSRWGTHLKNDIGAPIISPGFPGLPAFKPFSSFSWYVFAGVEGRVIARNIFLDGNTFRDSHSVDKKFFVADFHMGIAFHYKGLRISFSDMIRSKEYEGQPDQTHYGAINLTFYFAG